MPDLNENYPDSYKITFETWDKVAAAYQENFMDLDLYDDTYDAFCGLIEKRNPGIFEIGCGPGNITKYILSKRPDFRIEAIDISPNMIKLAEENNPEVDAGVMDCREIGKLTATYDAIMCGFCLAYLAKADVAKLIKDCSDLLNRGGIIYLSTIEGSYDKSGYETGRDGQNKMFIYYYQADFLLEELQANHFEIIEQKRKSFSKKDGAIQTHLILIAKKK
jgi:2-polyprenyl-3-methyl-5-hydroxy-6-metoxy-1,4-benzoquinol methylase